MGAPPSRCPPDTRASHLPASRARWGPCSRKPGYWSWTRRQALWSWPMRNTLCSPFIYSNSAQATALKYLVDGALLGMPQAAVNVGSRGRQAQPPCLRCSPLPLTLPTAGRSPGRSWHLLSLAEEAGSSTPEPLGENRPAVSDADPELS